MASFLWTWCIYSNRQRMYCCTGTDFVKLLFNDNISIKITDSILFAIFHNNTDCLNIMINHSTCIKRSPTMYGNLNCECDALITIMNNLGFNSISTVSVCSCLQTHLSINNILYTTRYFTSVNMQLMYQHSTQMIKQHEYVYM